MAITISNNPPTGKPSPVSDCLRWVLSPASADVLESNGFYPFVEIIWPASPTVPANGTEFTIWGHVFEVQSGSAFTANTFRVVSGNLAQTMQNFEDMLNANLFFLRAVAINHSGVDGNDMVIVWLQCREEENFSAAQMEFADLESGTGMSTPVAFSNGVSPVPVPGYQVVVALLRYNALNSLYEEITVDEGFNVNKDCSGAVPLPIDFMGDVRELLYTNLPDLNDTSFDVPNFDSMYQWYSLRYGWVYRDDNCQPVSGTFKKSAFAKVWNGAFDVQDAYGARAYFPGATGGLPPGQTYVKFLTSQPTVNYFDLDSKGWLWFFLNPAVTAFDEIKVLLGVKQPAGPVSYIDITLPIGVGGPDSVRCINVSPGWVIANTGIDPEDLVYYTIQILAYVGASFTRITEELTYYIERSCEAPTDIYFLTPPGGHGTLLVDTTDREVAQEGTEILLDTPCISTREERSKYRGRTLTALRAYETLTVRAKFDWSEEWVNYFRDLKASPHRWIRVPGNDGGWVARKFIISTGGIKVFTRGEHVELVATGILQDIPVQSTTEPLIL